MGAEDGPGSVEAVHLLPVGPFPRALAEELAARLSRHVSASCRVVDAAPPELVRLPGRDQVDADGLLGTLEARATPADTVLVGLTRLDIAIPIFTFVFGRARQGGRAAVVSLARLDPTFYGLAPDPDLLARRAAHEVVHELGHVASLAHCADAACIMSFAGSVERVDVRGSGFCDSCRARLPGWLRVDG
jgi:archaemetzincin